MAHRVIVVGSANVDYVIRVPTLPAAGETLLGAAMRVLPGGKGMNQAVASARLAAEVHFVGAVGADPDGRMLLDVLAAEGVGTDDVIVSAEERTGLAVVSVLPTGENSIVVVPGANSTVEPKAVHRAIEALAGPGDLVVVQCEVPAATVKSAVVAATAHQARAVVNLAPYTSLPDQTVQAADPLVLNEVEAAELSGQAVTTVEDAMLTAAALSALAKSVVITLGPRGACWASDGIAHHVPAPAVADVIDTTGAGDAFVGALAALLAEGADLPSAVSIAIDVASVSVTRHGAQVSYPRRAELASLG
jgi:ribokinase